MHTHIYRHTCPCSPVAAEFLSHLRLSRKIPCALGSFSSAAAVANIVLLLFGSCLVSVHFGIWNSVRDTHLPTPYGSRFCAHAHTAEAHAAIVSVLVACLLVVLLVCPFLVFFFRSQPRTRTTHRALHTYTTTATEWTAMHNCFTAICEHVV